MAQSKGKVLQARVPDEVGDEVEKLAAITGLTKSDWLRAAVQEKIARDTTTAASFRCRRDAASLAWQAQKHFFEGQLGRSPLPADLGTTPIFREAVESAADAVGGWDSLHELFNPPSFGHRIPANPAGAAARLQHIQALATVRLAFCEGFMHSVPEEVTAEGLGRPPAWLLPTGRIHSERQVKEELVGAIDERLLSGLKGSIDDPASAVGRRFSAYSRRASAVFRRLAKHLKAYRKLKSQGTSDG